MFTVGRLLAACSCLASAWDTRLEVGRHYLPSPYRQLLFSPRSGFRTSKCTHWTRVRAVLPRQTPSRLRVPAFFADGFIAYAAAVTATVLLRHQQ
jgi:hypothetical protein